MCLINYFLCFFAFVFLDFLTVILFVFIVFRLLLSGLGKLIVLQAASSTYALGMAAKYKQVP